MHESGRLTLDYRHVAIGKGCIVHADCLEWLNRIPEDSLHAVVTDPPYGLKEYDFDQLKKREEGCGGIWRIPPSFDGHKRAPLPRFTALTAKERERLFAFFKDWTILVLRCLRPGGHVFIATNAFIAQLLYSALVDGGLEFRGQIIRIVQTLRGGDRPKNAEEEFPGVASLPRGRYEPWGMFRKPLRPGMKVSDSLREYQTGGLRRNGNGSPFVDVIESQRTPKQERKIAPHPSLKPQAFLRRIVWASLPLGEGIIADPFMGSGSTIAAANALGLLSIGVEKNLTYFELSKKAIPRLQEVQAQLSTPDDDDDEPESATGQSISSLLPFSYDHSLSRSL
jgi:site-specific DNA-methyltransferase (adenine-specific)